VSQHRKHRGYRTQSLEAEYLRDNGFPYAESTGAGRAGTDITGTPGIDWEIGARRGFPVIEKMRQLDERAQDGKLGIVILRPDGMGEKSIDLWPFIVCQADGIALLRAAGYGTPPVTP
jgi:hypothetical protein